MGCLISRFSQTGCLMFFLKVGMKINQSDGMSDFKIQLDGMSDVFLRDMSYRGGELLMLKIWL